MKGRPEAFFLEQFSEKFMDHVRQVCTFAKSIPGFKCLHHEVRPTPTRATLASPCHPQDQVSLLKSCVFEVLLVRLSGLFDNQVGATLLSPAFLPQAAGGLVLRDGRAADTAMVAGRGEAAGGQSRAAAAHSVMLHQRASLHHADLRPFCTRHGAPPWCPAWCTTMVHHAGITMSDPGPLVTPPFMPRLGSGQKVKVASDLF
jgi:hypothetical protein